MKHDGEDVRQANINGWHSRSDDDTWRNQYRQQQQYYRSDWFEERERRGREDYERADNIRRRSTTINEHNEEMIEEQLQEVYDWEMMHLNDHLEQGQLYELEGIAALEQLSLVQDQMEQSCQLQTSQAFEDEIRPIQRQASENSVQTQGHRIENNLTPQSLDSILYHMEQMQQIDDITNHISKWTKLERKNDIK